VRIFGTICVVMSLLFQLLVLHIITSKAKALSQQATEAFGGKRMYSSYSFLTSALEWSLRLHSECVELTYFCRRPVASPSKKAFYVLSNSELEMDSK
jgi:hypothetical protein